MGLVVTSGSLLRQYNAFTGLSAIERSQSGIARAELVYYNVNDDWDTSSGNFRLYSSTQRELPKDFGYVVTDCYVSVTAAGSDQVYTEGVGTLRIYVGGVLGPQINVPLKSAPSRQDSAGATHIGNIGAGRFNSVYPFDSGAAKAAITYVMEDKPTALLYPFNSQTYTSTVNPATEFEFLIGENLANGPDYKVTSFVRFLQYDIDQSYNYVLQSPQLTR